jgi:hypothetical protein
MALGWPAFGSSDLTIMVGKRERQEVLAERYAVQKQRTASDMCRGWFLDVARPQHSRFSLRFLEESWGILQAIARSS